MTHENTISFTNFPRYLVFLNFLSFWIGSKLKTKTRKHHKFFNLWKLWTLLVKFSNTLPKYGIWHTLTLTIWISCKPPKKLLIPNYCSKWHSLFPTKEFFVQTELFWNFSSKWREETHENNTPFINLPCKWGFLSFSLLPSFRIASSSERKPRKTGNFWIFENFEFC